MTTDLSTDLWSALAIMVYGPGTPNEAFVLAARAQRELGAVESCVTARLIFGLISADQAACERAEIRRKVSAEKRRRKNDEHQRVARLSAPLRDPATVAALAELAADARMKRAEAESLRILGAKAFRSQIQKLKAEACKLDGKIEEIRLAELEQDRLYGDAKEPILLAKARGEIVAAADVEIATVARDEYGARIIHRRGPNKGTPALVYTRATRAKKFTGIEIAYLSGHLEGGPGAPKAGVLFQTGKSYWEAYEIVEGLRSNAGQGSGGFGPKGPQIKAVEAGQILSTMRAKLTLRELHVLNEVCGKGFRVRQVATAMKAGFPSTVRALRNGLRTAGEQVKAAGERGEIGVAGERVQAAHRVLQKVRA